MTELVVAAVCRDLDAGVPIGEVIGKVQIRIASNDPTDRRLGSAALMTHAVSVACPAHIDTWQATDLYQDVQR